MSKSERNWRADREAFGWKLPRPAGLFWRLPLIRAFRTFVIALRIERHYAAFSPWGIRNGYDDFVLYAIRRGWC